jgi:hypothetical protein
MRNASTATMKIISSYITIDLFNLGSAAFTKDKFITTCIWILACSAHNQSKDVTFVLREVPLSEWRYL